MKGLFKRDPANPESPWYWRGMVKGKRYLWSTKTADRQKAEQRAARYRDALMEEKFQLVGAMRNRSHLPTFAELLKQYDEMPLGILISTRKGYKAAMLTVLEASGYSASTRIDVLGRGLLQQYQRKALEQGVSVYTMNGIISAAKSLFSARALSNYDPAIPAGMVDDFKSVPGLPAPEILPELPTEADIEKAHRELPGNPPLYRAFLLAAYAGLRSGEIAAARWEWLAGDVLYVGGREFMAKSRKWRPVRLSPGVVGKLQPPAQATGSIVGKHAATIVRRQLPLVLRGLGFKSSHPVHSLRRWFGSMVAQQGGIHAAQTALGHSSPIVTSRHYLRLITMAEPVGITPPQTLALSLS